MTQNSDLDGLEVGYDIPARPGMHISEVQTPCLVLDLDALERNIRKMGDYAQSHQMRHRAHGKMHKSVDVARLQQRLGGASGLCCQKVSEAEAFVRGGIADVLISNEVRDPLKIDRLARLPMLGASVSVCADDLDNVAELSAAAMRHGTELGCLVEIDCGAGRCGVTNSAEALRIANAVQSADGLSYQGIQAYQGAMQHITEYADRQAKFTEAYTLVQDCVAVLTEAGLPPALVSGGGTGSFEFEGTSPLYNELQCGSYAFMDAEYGRVKNAEGRRLDQGQWDNALFVLTQVMSHTKAQVAVCDAGLKALSVDSGLPKVFGVDHVTYQVASDEHGVLADPKGVLAIGTRFKLVPGHCDPTVNLHDWFVGLRGDRVACLWPITARGKVF